MLLRLPPLRGRRPSDAREPTAGREASGAPGAGLVAVRPLLLWPQAARPARGGAAAARRRWPGGRRLRQRPLKLSGSGCRCRGRAAAAAATATAAAEGAGGGGGGRGGVVPPQSSSRNGGLAARPLALPGPRLPRRGGAAVPRRRRWRLRRPAAAASAAASAAVAAVAAAAWRGSVPRRFVGIAVHVILRLRRERDAAPPRRRRPWRRRGQWGARRVPRRHRHLRQGAAQEVPQLRGAHVGLRVPTGGVHR